MQEHPPSNPLQSILSTRDSADGNVQPTTRNPYRRETEPDTVLPRKYGGLPSRSEWEKESLIASFVGEENLPGVLARLHSQPRPISQIIPKILKERLASPNLAFFAALKAHWETIMINAFNASNTKPMRLSGTTLEIAVSNASFLYAFHNPMLKNQVIQRIAKVLGNGRVADIKFIAPGR